MQGYPKTVFWGKWSEETREFHPLIDHSADVAAVVEGLLKRTLLGRRLARLGELSRLTEPQIHALCFFAFLHDFGKVAIPFQRIAGPDHRRPMGHVEAALYLLTKIPRPLQTELLERLPTHLFPHSGRRKNPHQALKRFLICTVCHHGTPRPAAARFDPEAFRAQGGLDPQAELFRLVDAARRWFPDAYEADPLPTAPAFAHGWNGLLTLADWIGSTRTFFPYSDFPYSDDSDLEAGPGRMPYARERAAYALRRIGLEPSVARAALPDAPTFERISEHPPRHAQRAVAELAPSPAGSTAVLEASTGSGKTEAALWHFARLFRAGLVDGFYFALPTRSAASQIQRRIETIVRDRLLPGLGDDRPAVIQAVPGYLRADGLVGERLPGFEVAWSDAREIDSQKTGNRESALRAWAAEHGKRYMAGAFVVGTIDQALLATLRTRHSHLRAAGLLRHLLIVDEVHASDAYMGRLLEEVLAHHRRAGGHALLMSATLGSEARSRFLAAGGTRSPRLSLEDALAVPYPMVQLQAGDALDDPRAVDPETHSHKRVQVDRSAFGLMDDPARIARLALDAARRGARVLVIRNTVKGCRAVQEELERLARAEGARDLLFGVADDGGSVVPAPHHSRYSREDRGLLDRAVEQAFDPKRSGPSRGVVAVTTQTVEQSLDIDADLLLTDLCPMDVLLQRIGRLHRHAGLRRPDGFEDPRVVVLTPDRPLEDRLTEEGNARFFHGLGGEVYADLRVLEAGLHELKRRDVLDLPRDNRELVELTTHPEVLQRISERSEQWKKHGHGILGRGYMEKSQAKLNLLHWTELFGDLDLSVDLDKSFPTRLGLQDLLLELPTRPAGPFGVPVERLTVRPYEIREELDLGDVEPVVEPETVDGGFTFPFGGVRFRYDRLGLRVE